ncbi:polyprenyl synthetase family protein [Burkholderia sp. R-70006]|uniref:polyprenyl synthetase family protein n=1 Tax=Paraburkholderia domus TaxID=2793075 RepID=UPI0019145A56|nr:farnesyl diphosphate synthase [Paraburkholderia domus]MBK5052302.1 polyprenyl synthetase family protein [Burkholderia sp. R-70006]
MNHLSIRMWAKDIADRMECLLDTLLSIPDDDPIGFYDAMRYSVLDGGKRLRPMLCYAAAEAVGASRADADAAACAVELVHAYSLVHDDMPMMDNDVLRRGKPTVHVKFDEATALLVGDALQSLAFDALASSSLAPQKVVAQTRVLSKAIGAKGMVGGQVLDLQNCHRRLALDELEKLHSMKTGALIRAAVLTGGLCNAPEGSEKILALEKYAFYLGLAFQIVDDILDVTSDSAVLGKTPGKDAEQNKATYVSLLGLDGAKDVAEMTRQKAVSALSPFGEQSWRLEQLTELLVNRES